MRFTDEQQKVIDTRNRNLLVSAAAGSGKTAVLVERIIRMVTDSLKPVPVTELLVVTFTNAAAAEMRERITNALYKEIEHQPENVYLQQQLTLMPSAHVMTLHAFCLKVIRNHFYRIDLDPGFAIGSEADLILMGQEVMAEVLESFYEEGSQDFLELVEGYASGKSDKAIEELIIGIYRMSRSHPTPDKWLASSVDRLRFHTLEDWYASAYVTFICEEIKSEVNDLWNRCNEALEMIGDEPGLQPIALTIRHYMDVISNLTERLDQPKELFLQLATLELPRAKSAKRGTDESLTAPVKRLRDLIKERLKRLADAYGTIYDDRFIKQMADSHRHMQTLTEVVNRYAKVYREKKLSKNLMDFNDIEHYALQILLKEDGSASEVARGYQKQFTEVLTDEYQDTNLVQETLIQAVSRMEQGNPNIFMVGDIKQSIYKFRLAKPELFVRKYETYTTDDSDYQKIELHKNFRSRYEIISMTNYLFQQLMSKEVGDVTYDEHAALHQGAVYDIQQGPYASELVLLDRKDLPGTASEIEAMQLVHEIQRLMAMDPPMMVFDKETGNVRRLMYKDIVILLRTMAGWSETFVSVLKDHSIPVASNTATGYFETLEIQTLLNLLRIIDNPKQDIPLLSVLRSPIFSFTGDDLVAIRLVADDVDYFEALRRYHISSLGYSQLDMKVRGFFERLYHWRKKRNSLSIYELVRMVLEETGYDDYASLMPGGQQRHSNIEMFLGIVYEYEQSTYKGLFNFLSYMENVKKHSVDMGEAALDGDHRNQVTIMSIHGSKGLEFPVVILGALSKQFHRGDLKKSVLLHQDYGFGTDRVLVEDRQKLPSPTKEVIKQIAGRELLSEELRILYVALTRAREKLIFLGSVRDMEKSVDRWMTGVQGAQSSLPVMTVRSGDCYLDWIMWALIRHPSCSPLLAHSSLDLHCQVLLMDYPELVVREVSGEKPTPTVPDEGGSDYALTNEEVDLDRQLCWQYPYENLKNLHLSQSVSELKRLAHDPSTVSIHPDWEKSSYRPKFITGEQPLTGAEKGTLFHLVMDQVDFSIEPEAQDVGTMLERLMAEAVVTQKEVSTLHMGSISNFLSSDLGRRVHEAAKRNQVKKEQPFVMGIPASELTETPGEDSVMIQGVLDLHFEEEDGLVIVDYKTDYMKDLSDDQLVNRYKTQMIYYKSALEQSSSKKVKEIWLYAVSANRAVAVPIRVASQG